tara:strand:+ start:1047 stop:1487 length:441 start_codon:yes stop_codon:yes gene_type:complete
MKKIIWCLKQKKGIEFVEPNDNLSEAYFNEAENTLKLILGKKNKWELIMAYYACYNAFYALLIKTGIKCEIHDCTLEIIKLFSQFTDEDYEFISLLKDKRVQTQYYLKEIYLDNINQVKKFVMKCKEISLDLDRDELRGKLNDQKN